MKTVELLMNFSEIDAPSGYEDPALEKIEEILGSGFRTRLGGYVHEIKGEGKGKVGIFAHVDEISLVVAKKARDGFFYLETSGGVDPKVVVSSKARVHTSKGVVRGVIGTMAPHITPKEERGKPLDFDRLVLDATMSDWEKIEIGDRVVIDSRACEIGNLVCGKALDNRAGCVALIGVWEHLKRMKHSADVYLIFSSLEEVGGPGARSIAYELELDWAIVVDVTFGDEKIERYNEIKLGKGPALGVGPSVDREFFEKAKEVAKKNGVNHQIEPLPGRSGTDTDDVQLTRAGVKTLLVSIPLKNMHTPVEIVDPKDVEETSRLIALLVSELEV